jgi:hypothetical protein
MPKQGLSIGFIALFGVLLRISVSFRRKGEPVTGVK